MQKRKLAARAAATVLALAVFFLALNFQYTLKHLVYYFWDSGPEESGSASSRQQGLPKDFLLIPSLDIGAPIVFAQNREEGEYQRLLAQGVVHVPDTALPGEAGNCFIFGHSSDLFWRPGQYKTVFALLPQIRTGEEIILTDGQGRAATYRVAESFAADADRVDLLLAPEGRAKILTLQTSWPLGTALKRWIVRAEIRE